VGKWLEFVAFDPFRRGQLSGVAVAEEFAMVARPDKSNQMNKHKIPKLPFSGTGRDKAGPSTTVTDQDYLWDDRVIPAGSETKQFETDVSSWVIWKQPDGVTGIKKQTIRRARQLGR